MLAVRLLAVYFASTTLALLAVRRWVSRVPLRSAVFLALVPFVFVGPAMVRARIYAPIDITYVHEPFKSMAEEKGMTIVRSPILSDVVFSMIPWHKAVREAVKNGRLPLWNRFQLAGEPLLAVQQHGALHPETFPFLLLPLAQGWTLLMALRFFIAAASAYLYLRDVVSAELPALFGSAAWAFSDFLVFFSGYPLSPAIGPFPLLLLGLRRLAVEQGWRGAGITVIALVLAVTAGHPESLLHVVAAAGVYFLFEIARAGRRGPGAVGKSLLAGALTLGICAVVLLPLAEALPVTSEHLSRSGLFAHQKKSVPLALSGKRLLRDVVPYAYGVTGYGPVVSGFDEPGAYAGAIVLPLAWLGLRSRRRERWALAGLGILGLWVSIGLPGITDAVGWLPLFRIAINDRLNFLFAFALVALGALGVERIERREAGRELVIAGFVTAAVIAALTLHVRPGAAALWINDSELARRAALQLVPLLVLVAAALTRVRASFIAAATIVLLLVERRLESGRLYPSYSGSAFAPDVPVLDPIPRGTPWRFAAVGYEFIPNVSSLYELEDVRSYSSMTLLPMSDTFSLWCVPQHAWFNRIDDPTRPFLNFLNVRYVLLPPGEAAPAGWRVLAKSAGGTLVENRAALPRVFVPEKVAWIASPAAQLGALGQISDFRRLAIAERAGAGEDVPAGAPNGPARAWITSYGTQQMKIEVEGEQPAIVATSVPRWPGWKLSVDGDSAPMMVINRAFIGFRVPAGHHSARLRYLPDSVLAGIGISAVSLAGCIFLGWRSGRNRPDRSSRPNDRPSLAAARGLPGRRAEALPKRRFSPRTQPRP